MQIQKTLVIFAVEQAIIDIGGNVMKAKISNKLFSKYGSSIEDCFEKPQQMNDVLNEVCGNSHNQLIEEITKNLDEFVQIQKIAKFLSKIK